MSWLSKLFTGAIQPQITGRVFPVTPTGAEEDTSSGGTRIKFNRLKLRKPVHGKASGIVGPLDGFALGRVVAPIYAEASGSLSALALSAAPEVTPYDFTEQGQQDLASILLSL